MKKLIFALGIAAVFGALFFGMNVSADHSWGNYHWARTANPVSISLGDNVTAVWDAHLTAAAGDWMQSSVLDAPVIAGGSNPKNCRATSGRVEVCNSKYGSNGWLGIAQVWVSGSHITQGVVKLNDTYFNTARYNTPAWRRFVVCQEIGHTFGLNHQDEIFTNANIGSCMDYTNDPSTNQNPNAHDYELLENLYAHVDTFTSAVNRTAAAPSKGVDLANPSQWGRQMKTDGNGRGSLYARDLGRGEKVFTFVLWAD